MWGHWHGLNSEGEGCGWAQRTEGHVSRKEWRQTQTWVDLHVPTPHPTALLIKHETWCIWRRAPSPNHGLVSVHALSIQVNVHEGFLVSYKRHVFCLERFLICYIANTPTPKANVTLKVAVTKFHWEYPSYTQFH